ncbi:MAG: hypothetical protein KKA60_04230 [Proteobacteria bacterium]|nr:hypothetical protein [Pseudomonadota bacterium]
MVQVDVFWSYAIGASFAAAAARQIKDVEKPFESKYFTYALAYLAMLFAPSGMYLLWNFPDWETMQVARTHGSLPAWLVTAFVVTNITQGILGFWVAWKFIRRGNYYMAHLQWFLGYFLMFYILLYGWDGSGWQRFLYDSSVNNGVHWTPGTHMGFGFLFSNVAITLAVMGVAILPAKFIPMARWIVAGAKADPAVSEARSLKSVGQVVVLLGTLVMVVTLASAATAAILSHLAGLVLGSAMAGIPVGLAVFAGAGWFLLFREGRPVYKVFRLIFIRQPSSD